MFAIVDTVGQFVTFDEYGYATHYDNVFNAYVFDDFDEAFENVKNLIDAGYRLVEVEVKITEINVEGYQEKMFQKELAELKKKWKV